MSLKFFYLHKALPIFTLGWVSWQMLYNIPLNFQLFWGKYILSASQKIGGRVEDWLLIGQSVHEALPFTDKLNIVLPIGLFVDRWLPSFNMRKVSPSNRANLTATQVTVGWKKNQEPCVRFKFSVHDISYFV